MRPVLCLPPETDGGNEKQVEPDILGPCCTHISEGSDLPLIGVLEQVYQALGLIREREREREREKRGGDEEGQREGVGGEREVGGGGNREREGAENVARNRGGGEGGRRERKGSGEGEEGW